MSEKHAARIQTYSGYRADERPLSFTVYSRTHYVSRVSRECRMLTAEGKRMEIFRVTTRKDLEFLLEHSLDSDEWFVTPLNNNLI